MVAATHLLGHTAVEESADGVWLPFGREKEKARGNRERKRKLSRERLKAAGVEEWRKERREGAG